MDHRYLKRLITFSHDKVGNIANLSRIHPSLLGIKDANSFTNALYLHGISSALLLCFSLILVTQDSHEGGHTFGSGEKEWVLKDIAGVMLALELEHFIAVLGLAYELPYVPDDRARREKDLLYLRMVDNAFSFTTTMMSKSGEQCLIISTAIYLEFTTDFYKADSPLLNMLTRGAYLHQRVQPSPTRLVDLLVPLYARFLFDLWIDLWIQVCLCVM